MKELRALTAEELARAEARLRNPAPGSRIEAAKIYGIDLGLLIENLRISPTERIQRMEGYAEDVWHMRGAARRRQTRT